MRYRPLAMLGLAMSLALFTAAGVGASPQFGDDGDKADTAPDQPKRMKGKCVDPARLPEGALGIEDMPTGWAQYPLDPASPFTAIGGQIGDARGWERSVRQDG